MPEKASNHNQAQPVPIICDCNRYFAVMELRNPHPNREWFLQDRENSTTVSFCPFCGRALP